MTIAEWCTSHPFTVSLAWPVGSALVTWAFRKHTTDELAALPRWLLRVIVFCESMGVDAPGVLLVARDIIKPRGPTV